MEGEAEAWGAGGSTPQPCRPDSPPAGSVPVPPHPGQHLIVSVFLISAFLGRDGGMEGILCCFSFLLISVTQKPYMHPHIPAIPPKREDMPHTHSTWSPVGVPPDCSVKLRSLWNSSGKNTAVGCHALLQGIFPTQGLNPGLPHCRQILYHLNH